MSASAPHCAAFSHLRSESPGTNRRERSFMARLPEQEIDVVARAVRICPVIADQSEAKGKQSSPDASYAAVLLETKTFSTWDSRAAG